MPPARVVLYAASAAVLVMAVRAVLFSPPPMFWVAIALAAYLGFILWGVLALRLRLFVDAIVRGPRGARGVALTFDDGPDPVWTPRVLDALDEAKVKATFFVIAKKAEAQPELVKQILARGHSVGLHSYAHDRLFSLRNAARVRSDLKKGMRVLEEITGERPSLFRPPIGHTNPIIARVVDELELTVVGWTVSARDGVRASPEDVVARVRGGASDGAIVLMHDASERGDHEPAGPRALPGVLEALAEARLEVVPLQRFLE